MKQLTLTTVTNKKDLSLSSLAKDAAVVTPVEKARRDSKIPTSQELAKDPDPKPGPTKLDFSHPSLFSKKYTLRSFAKLATVAKQSMYIGTKALASWLSAFPNKFDDPAERYNWQMHIFNNEDISWAEGAERIASFCQSDWTKIETFLVRAWDPAGIEAASELDSDQDDLWKLRRFSYAIATQDPTVLFDIDEEDLPEEESTPFQSTFWDNENWFNPRFKPWAHPLAELWLLCASTLGHPWGGIENTKAEEETSARKKRQADAREAKKSARKRISQASQDEDPRPNAPFQPSSPDKAGVRWQIADVSGAEKTIANSNSSSPKVQTRASLSHEKISANHSRRDLKHTKVANAAGNHKKAAVLLPSALKKKHRFSSTEQDEDDLPELEPAPEHGIDDSSDEEDDLPPLNGGRAHKAKSKRSRLKKADRQHLEESREMANEVQVTKVQKKVSKISLSSATKEGNESERIDLEKNAAQEENKEVARDVSSPPHIPRASSRPGTSPSRLMGGFTFGQGASHKSQEDSGMAVDSPSGTPRRSYSQVATASPQRPPLPEEQRFDSLVQMDIQGLPAATYAIFAVAIGFMWNGSAGKNTIGQRVVAVIHELWQLLFQTKNDFKILPISDTNYRSQRKWITNNESMKRLAGKWHQMKNYLDMQFGNAEWISSQGKQAGSKILRTRMRFAFQDTEEGAMAIIGSILEEDGGDCRRSPLQFGDMTRIGFLPFYPPGMSRLAMERAFMKHLDFSTPVGLGMDWAATPNVRRNIWKPGFRSPSARLWHIFVKSGEARRVDTRLRQWLHPSTPKRDFPYAAITQYCHDWKAVNKNKLVVNPYGPVRELISTMVTKSIDFVSVTETFCTPIPIPGMLKVLKTEKFGETSLLKLLMAIKATPAQAESAQSEPSTDSNPGEQPKGKDEEDDFTEVINKKKAKRKVDAQEVQDRLMKASQESAKYEGRPGAFEAAQRADLVREKDKENMDSAPLFQIILPETSPQYYCLTVREKFVQLALNVINGLCAFLIYHLDETRRKNETKIISSWLGLSELQNTRRRGQVWDPERLVAHVPTNGAVGARVDHSMDWLDFGRDVLDQVSGFLEIDMSLAEIRDIDDGATVAGAVDELREVENRLELMAQEVLIREDANARLQAENAALQEQVRKQAVMMAQHPLAASAEYVDHSSAAESDSDDESSGSIVGRGGKSSAG